MTPVPPYINGNMLTTNIAIRVLGGWMYALLLLKIEKFIWKSLYVFVLFHERSCQNGALAIACRRSPVQSGMYYSMIESVLGSLYLYRQFAWRFTTKTMHQKCQTHFLCFRLWKFVTNNCGDLFDYITKESGQNMVWESRHATRYRGLYVSKYSIIVSRVILKGNRAFTISFYINSYLWIIVLVVNKLSIN